MPPRVQVEVGGTRRKVKLTALLDTGFDGAVCVPVETAVHLGLELVGKDSVEFADGSIKSELFFQGTAKLMGKTRRVDISLTDSDEPMVGTDLLSGLRVTMDFPECRVHLKQRPSKAS